MGVETNKHKMRAIMEKHAEDHVNELSTGRTSQKDLDTIRRGILHFVSSKQMELFEDLFEKGRRGGD